MKLWLLIIVALATLGMAAHSFISELDSAPTEPGHAPGHARRSPQPAPAPQLAVPLRPWAAHVTAVNEPANTSRDQDKDTPGGTAAPAPTFAETRDRLDGLFHSEGVDLVWSQEAMRTLGGKLPALLPTRSVVRSVDCRGSLCRIETSHTSVDDYRDFIQRAFLSSETRLWDAGFFAGLLAEPEPGQPIVNVAYLAHEGQDLPATERPGGHP
jgi:hypothetical protein